MAAANKNNVRNQTKIFNTLFLVIPIPTCLWPKIQICSAEVSARWSLCLTYGANLVFHGRTPQGAIWKDFFYRAEPVIAGAESRGINFFLSALRCLQQQ